MKQETLFDFEKPWKPPTDRPVSGTLSESDGNRLFIDGNFVKLKLHSEPRTRVLATIMSNDTLIVQRTRSKHLHRKSNSYGFNYLMLERMPYIRQIILRDDYGEFRVDADIVRDAKCMNFKFAQDGNEYELQHFVPLSVVEGGRV